MSLYATQPRTHASIFRRYMKSTDEIATLVDEINGLEPAADPAQRSSGSESVLQESGDLLTRNTDEEIRLPVGDPGQVLFVSDGGMPEWQTLPTAEANKLGMIKVGAGLEITNDALHIMPASDQSLGGVKVLDSQPAGQTALHYVMQDLTGLYVQKGAGYELPEAKTDELGGVKVGTTMSVDGDGVINVDQSGLTKAGVETLGVVRIGTGLDVNNDGVISVNIPAATAADLGGVRIKDDNGSVVDRRNVRIDAQDKYLYVDIGNLPNATTSTKGLVQVGSGLDVVGGALVLDLDNVQRAEVGVAGVATVGAGLSVSATGMISIKAPESGNLGGVKEGSFVQIGSDGTISARTGAGGLAEQDYVNTTYVKNTDYDSNVVQEASAAIHAPLIIRFIGQTTAPANMEIENGMRQAFGSDIFGDIHVGTSSDYVMMVGGGTPPPVGELAVAVLALHSAFATLDLMNAKMALLQAQLPSLPNAQMIAGFKSIAGVSGIEGKA